MLKREHAFALLDFLHHPVPHQFVLGPGITLRKLLQNTAGLISHTTRPKCKESALFDIIFQREGSRGGEHPPCSSRPMKVASFWGSAAASVHQHLLRMHNHKPKNKDAFGGRSRRGPHCVLRRGAASVVAEGAMKLVVRAAAPWTLTPMTPWAELLQTIQTHTALLPSTTDGRFSLHLPAP